MRSRTNTLASLALAFAIGALTACSAGAQRPAAPAGSRVSPSGPSAAAPPVEEGESFEAAVLVDAADEKSGVDRENDWIFRHYGRFRKKTVALSSREGRRFDVITIELADHSEKTLYFDITDFFGK